jgi:enhancing lycopene biosynthesis protein 2
MKKVAVILSGCGVFDGAEIHESVLTLLALDRAGAEAVCAAPDIPQHHVINHANGKPAALEKRNVLAESARIARGRIVPLQALNAADVDAVLVPGGFGAAKNFSDFAFAGAAMRVNPEVGLFLLKAHRLGKPIGLACIAPVLAAKLFGAEGVQLTVGNDPATAQAINQMGARHVDCAVDDIVVDSKLKIITTPAYMLASRITEAEAGINKLVQAILAIA